VTPAGVFLSIVGARRGLWGFLLLCAAGVAACELAIPWLLQHAIDAARERPDAPVSAPSTPSPGVRGGTLPHPWERSGVYTPDPKFEAFIDDRFKDDSDRDVLIDAARVVFYPECQPTVTADHVGIEKMKTLFATVREYEESLDRQ